MKEKNSRYFSSFIIFVLVLFCVHYIPLETRAGSSMIKTGVSFLCLFLLFLKPPHVSKGLLLPLLYYMIVLSCVSFSPQTFRWSTMLYLLSFVIVYITFYDAIVCRKAISYDIFVKIIKGLIYAYTIVLLLQQVLLIVGIREFPLFNLTYYLNRGIGANSFSQEPATSARIMAVLYLALIRMAEIKYSRRVRINDLWRDYKWETLGFLWVMLTMSSGTAFIALGLLSFYFVRWRTAIYIIPLLCGLFFVGQKLEITAMKRAVVTAEAFATGDSENVIEADGSAADRVVPMMNFFKLNFLGKDTWLGHGIDFDANAGDIKKSVIGGINDYGMLSFIILMILVYSCMIRRFFSMETLLFLFLFGLTIKNVAFVWGCMMIFTTVRYFQEQNEKGLLELDDERYSNNCA